MKKTLFCLLLTLFACATARAQEPFMFPEEVKPLLKTHWGQGYPFNLLCPKSDDDSESANHNLAGCGPVAMAQMVNFHQYPSVSPDGKYEYDWELMYRSVQSGLSKEEVVAVAKLISDCGVSSFTKYSDKGSSTSLALMMGALKRLFQYSNDMCIYVRDEFKTPQRDSLFRQLIFEELKAGRPVLYRGYSEEEKGGHLFIIDGCRKQKVHVNMGWGGHRDGYYDLDNLGTYSQQQWLLIEVADSNYHAPVKEIVLKEGGTLASLLTDQERLTTRHIQVSGPMDKSDFAVLRDMLRTGLLRTVDLEHAGVNVLPDSAFFECTYLSHFVAPRTLLRTGNFSFYRCRNLNNIVFHEGLRMVGNAAFSGCNNLLSVRLPSTTTKIGYNAFTSCETLLNITLPEGVNTINNYAFSFCKNLYSVSLPKTVKTIGKMVFLQCDRLHRITIAPDNPWYEVEGLDIRSK